MEIEPPGLRERKRLATRRAIEVAVIELSTERGFDRVTVEEIGHHADISPRTFFNYFPSKEAAALGDGPQLPDGAALARFVDSPGSDILSDIGTLLADAVDLGANDVELMHSRRAMLKEHPQLFAMRMATMRSFEEELAVIVGRRLAREQPELAADPAALESEARLITLIAFGAMRHAWSSWADAEGRGLLRDRVHESFAGLRRLVTEPVR